MTTLDEKDYMRDAQGNLVPRANVKPEDILEDGFVTGLMEKAAALSEQIAAFKTEAFGEADAFLSLLADKYGVRKGGAKGNVTFLSFDGKIKVQISNADFLAFGPQLQIAKQLIDEFLKEEAGAASSNLKTIVFHAFRVDKEGKVNKGEILGLRRLKIDNEKWAKAMEAITDSLRVLESRRYIRFYRRDSVEGAFVPVTLDMAKVA